MFISRDVAMCPKIGAMVDLVLLVFDLFPAFLAIQEVSGHLRGIELAKKA